MSVLRPFFLTSFLFSISTSGQRWSRRVLRDSYLIWSTCIQPLLPQNDEKNVARTDTPYVYNVKGNRGEIAQLRFSYPRFYLLGEC